MRIVKRLHENDSGSAMLSRAFDSAIREFDLPIRFDHMEFDIGYSACEVQGARARFGIIPEEAHDLRAAKALVLFELYRLELRTILTEKLPHVIEDIIVGREMASRHSDDLAHLLYIDAIRTRVSGYAAFLRFNLPWIVFWSRDDFYHDLFFQLSKSVKRSAYESRSEKLFGLLCTDLSDDGNLRNAIEAYEEAAVER